MNKIALAALTLTTLAQSSFAWANWTGSSQITQVSAFSGCKESAGKEVLWVTQAGTTYFVTSADAGYPAIKETVMQAVVGKRNAQLWIQIPGEYTISLNSGILSAENDGCVGYKNFQKIMGAAILTN